MARIVLFPAFHTRQLLQAFTSCVPEITSGEGRQGSRIPLHPLVTVNKSQLCVPPRPTIFGGLWTLHTGQNILFFICHTTGPCDRAPTRHTYVSAKKESSGIFSPSPSHNHFSVHHGQRGSDHQGLFRISTNILATAQLAADSCREISSAVYGGKIACTIANCPWTGYAGGGGGCWCMCMTGRFQLAESHK